MDTRTRCPAEWREHIEINPRIKGGRPIIKGTRVPIEVIVGALAGGADLKEVSEAHAATRDQVRACLVLAGELLAEERFVAIPA